MTDVINLSIERDFALPPSIQLYMAPSPSVAPADKPYVALSPSVPSIPSEPDLSPVAKAQDFEFGRDYYQPSEARINSSRTQSSVTLVKRPGLNAIRSKRMLLLTSPEGDESMPDTDAEF
ncbi:hypothetical protein BVRB_042960 [Beta vulgaris subsp. vulgaris]|uniref:Uncharacterized protein n=1 Tax=Beta vulgaris subsp. vulgaris TaxID=3555 RepID=A0A0J7YNQ0_BETVV|nr:hypothetical protein BVRB_042960 [Beta vulgaris subsp. vulgaris]